MRLKSVELSGFRGFASPAQIDLSADATILVGANGRGKTCLLDSILWALSGKIPRLGDDSNVVSLYSESGQARVELELEDNSSRVLKIFRSTDGVTQRLDLEFDGERSPSEFAYSRLLQLLWPEALSSSDTESAFTTALTKSVYLQQDLVREFIDADSEQERFKSVSELVGSGRVTELQSELERGRIAWTRATTLRTKELDDARDILARHEEQLSRLSPPDSEPGVEFAELWSNWWQSIQEFGTDVNIAPSTESTEASTSLDNAVKQLEVFRRTAERRRLNLEELLQEVESRPEDHAQDPEAVVDRLQEARNELATASDSLTAAEEQSAREREAMVQAREVREELRSLAQLSIRHLSDNCPVCGQLHDVANTRRRMDELLGDPGEAINSIQTAAETVSLLAAEVQQKQQNVLNLEAELRGVQETVRRQRVWIADRDNRLTELGFDPDAHFDLPERLMSLIHEIALSIQRMTALQNQGEALALRLTRMGEITRRAEVEQAVLTSRSEVERLENNIQSREQTGLTVTRLIDALREAMFDVVDSQLRQIESVLQRIYATMDPHPAFRAVRFTSRISRGRGHLSTTVDDLERNVSTGSPETILSSSQINALAVAVFLSFNLSVSSIPIEATILDDPLQSLDDVNLLGMIDLLRRGKENRQLIIATHDSRFGQLLQRKLRPIRSGQRTSVIEFNGWSREAPDLFQWDVEPQVGRVLAVA